MSIKPGVMHPICPGCGLYIFTDEATGKFQGKGPLFHADCVERIEQANAEVDEVREATS